MLDRKPQHLAIVRALIERHVPEYEVWAYGSRLTGQAQEGSDLDLVVRNSLDLETACGGLWELRDAFTESKLPFLVDTFDWAQIPEHFRRGIEREHVVVWRRDGAVPGLEARS